MNKNTVYDIQHALRQIASRDTRIPLVTVDGIYSPQTAEAVSIFQQIENLPISGAVDPVTFDRLIQRSVVTAVSPIEIFPHPTYVIRPQEETEIIPFIKAILNVLSASYNNIPYVGTDAVYDAKTVDAIRSLQRLHNLNDDGIIDRDTWNILVNLFGTRPSLRSDLL